MLENQMFNQASQMENQWVIKCVDKQAANTPIIRPKYSSMQLDLGPA